MVGAGRRGRHGPSHWDHPLRPWFSILVMIWYSVVKVTWSNFLAYPWGTLDYQEEVVVRPEFKGTEYQTCTITNTQVRFILCLYYSSSFK